MNAKRRLILLTISLALVAGPAIAQDPQQETVVKQRTRGSGALQGQDVFIKITIAAKKKKYRELMVYANSSPSYFGCDYPDFMLALLDAYQELGEAALAEQLYTTAATQCNDRVFLTDLYARPMLDHPRKMALLTEAAAAQPGNRIFLKQLKLNYLIQYTSDAIAGNGPGNVSELDVETMSLLREKQDVNGAGIIAWKYLDAGKNKEALRWFNQVDQWGGLDENMRQGRELARRRAQDSTPQTKVLGDPTPLVDAGPKQPEKSRAELFKEKELWDLIGEGKFDETRAEIYNFRGLVPNWNAPEKMRKILEEQAYRQKITREEQLLWRLLEKEEFELLEAQMERVQKTYPEWQPPADMVKIKNDRLITGRIDRAIKAEDWDALHKLHTEHNNYFNCSRIDYLWAHAHMHGVRMEWEEARKAYMDIIADCRSEYREDTLAKAINELPEKEVERFLEQMMSVNAAPDFLEQLLTARYHLDLKRLSDAIDAKDLAKSTSMSVLLEDEIRQRKDPDGAALLAWSEYKREAWPEALKWYETAKEWGGDEDSANSGIILTHFNSGEKDKALEVVKSIPEQGVKVRQASSVVYSTMCWDLYENEEYEEVLEIIEELKKSVTLSREERILEAWSLNGVGQGRDASEIFEELYLARPDKATASGLIATTPDSQLTRLQKITEVQPGPLDDMLGPEIGKSLYESKRYLEVNKYFPDMYRQLRNITRPSLQQAVVFRNKKGIKGPGELQITQIPVFGGELVLAKTHQVSGGISRVTMETGTLEVGKPLGNFPSDPRLAQTWSYATTDGLDQGFSTFFDYRWHHAISPHISLESTPSEGVFDPVLTWGVDVSGSGALSFWKLGAFARPVKESLLSYTGMIDPYLGIGWGQVVRTGFEAVGVKEMEDWGIHASINASNFDGQNVAENSQLGGSLTLRWETQQRRFDTLSFGSRLLFDSFENNQHHFTFGHGGYFSPKEFVQMGGVFSMQTREARNFIVAGDVELGYQEHTQELSPLFPLLTNSARFFQEEETDGMVYLVNFRGVYRMTRSWQLGGEIMQRKTALYSDTAVSAHLRFVFGKRRKLFSTDLQPQLLERIF